MGWLQVNRSRVEITLYRKYIQSSKAKRRKITHNTPHDDSARRLATLATLPKELLEKVFIYSGNIQLPFVSRQIQAKLAPHYYLESKFILEQVHGGVAPISVLNLPFTSAELLDALSIKKFEPMVVPHSLLVGRNDPNNSDEELLIYLLRGGLTVDDAPKCYGRFLSNSNNTGLKLLISQKLAPSKENLMLAIEKGNKYANRMAALFDTSEKELYEVWELAQKYNRKRTLRVLGGKL